LLAGNSGICPQFAGSGRLRTEEIFAHAAVGNSVPVSVGRVMFFPTRSEAVC
jgi:hypothetical protein